MATTTQSLPVTRVPSPSSSSTPPKVPSTPSIPASLPVPTDIRSSLSAWWSNSSYKDARIAESRLLLRIPTFSPSPPQPPNTKSWFSWSSSSTTDRVGEEVVPPVQIGETGLIATLKNVFIPTPNPDDAPKHPADPRGSEVVPNEEAGSASSSSSSLARKSSLKAGFEGRVGGKGKGEYKDYINTLEISSMENKDCKEAVVVLHGYAAALGFFFRNWEPIATSSASTGRRTFFLDWLGMGLSSRPSPNLLSSPSSSPIPTRVSRAEHFFLASLESWRIASGLDKMVLVGHSLGGYLASAYAVRYPERVSGLILVSPAGIPRGPEYRKFKTSGEAESAEREEAVDAVEMEMDGAGYEPKGEAKQWKENRQTSVLRRGATKFFVWGWEKGLSPFSILRGIGPLGPLMAGRYSLRRFAAQSEEDVRDLHAYIYNTSIMKGSGEFCISHILSPGAHARIPILDRIGQVKVPVTFLYGENDWMDVEGGRASAVELNKAGNNNAKVHVVPKAGHHVYLDNSERTNQLIDEALKALPKPANA